jgi:hypothetical protein
MRPWIYFSNADQLMKQMNLRRGGTHALLGPASQDHDEWTFLQAYALKVSIHAED